VSPNGPPLSAGASDTFLAEGLRALFIITHTCYGSLIVRFRKIVLIKLPRIFLKTT
jgi:hypothetical protein